MSVAFNITPGSNLHFPQITCPLILVLPIMISLSKHGMNYGNLFLAKLKTALPTEAYVFLSQLSASPTVTTNNNDILYKDDRIKTVASLRCSIFLCRGYAVV